MKLLLIFLILLLSSCTLIEYTYHLGMDMGLLILLTTAFAWFLVIYIAVEAFFILPSDKEVSDIYPPEKLLKK